MEDYQPHELAEMFPAMTWDAYADLASDIRENGLRQPIVLYEDKILDGRNRYRACKDGGVEPRFKKYEGDDPVGLVISLNLMRRHLTLHQKSLLGVKIEKALAEQARKRQEQTRFGSDGTVVAPVPPPDAGKARDQAARLVGVSPRVLQNAKRVENKGVPELRESMKSASIPIKSAAAIAGLPQERQHEIMAQGAAVAKKVATAMQAGVTLPEDGEWDYDAVCAEYDKRKLAAEKPAERTVDAHVKPVGEMVTKDGEVLPIYPVSPTMVRPGSDMFAPLSSLRAAAVSRGLDLKGKAPDDILESLRECIRILSRHLPPIVVTDDNRFISR